MNKTIKKELVLLQDLGMLFPSKTSKQKSRYGLYKCYCGKEFKAITQSVKSNHTQSCGCYNKLSTTKHGFGSHRLYNIWYGMIQRCYNQKRKDYKYYGDLGIDVCNRWLNIVSFIEDMLPLYQDGLTLDRIDNNKGYSKENCRWVNRNIQSENTRKIRSNNTSGFRGVSWNKYSNKWISKIGLNNKVVQLGYFDTALEGALVYDKFVLDNNLEHTLNFKRKNND